ncbi:G5 and 3D domain-containing protein [Thalassobacillus sp. CUG 92003]|uniref:G5 and 3D domain-containing protein n=1 Tax=Thalassobacillus sp. CUG 92003 TaxID=2736641 RepID=UPI0015E64127|nr:G5 and 3D domain-containing protein [Thalassobacillus sp. CUG 92003]
MQLFSVLKSVFKSKLTMIVLSTVAFIAFLGVLTFEVTKTSVQVSHDGETSLIRTHSNTVGDLLDEMNMNVKAQDRLSHELDTPITYGMKVDYLASQPVNVAIDGEKTEYYTTASTVGELLEEKEIKLKEHDEMSHQPEAAVKPEMTIDINKAIELAVNDGGDKAKVWTTASTVGEFLQEEDIDLNKLDEIKPAKKAELTADTSLAITRVEKVTDIVEEDVVYSVKKKSDSSLEKGKEKVVASGQKGVIEKEYEVTLKNGKEVDRELVEERTKEESEQRIVAIGTKVEQSSRSNSSSSNTASASTTSSSSNSSSNSGSSSDSSTVSRGEPSGTKTLSMSATAYTANCGGCSGITATGINLKANPNKKVVAVDPSVIPLGSRVWVEGYGYAIAGDTGGAINGNKIDLFISSQSKAQSFGRRTVQVKVLD